MLENTAVPECFRGDYVQYKNCLCAVLGCVYACGVCNEVYKWERKVLMRLSEML